MKQPKRFLIFDAGPIISLSMNGLLYVIEKLRKDFDGDFVITPRVKKEVVDRPLGIKKYELEALRVKDLLDKKVLRVASDFVSANAIEKETKRILKSANSLFSAEGEKINLIQEADASCLAFSRLCGVENLIVVDERTTRMLTEAPENLRKIMSSRLHTSIKVKIENLKELEGFKFIRSAEVVYIAYKKGLINLEKSKQLLDALLYGLKFKGTAISSQEIDVILGVGGC